MATLTGRNGNCTGGVKFFARKRSPISQSVFNVVLMEVDRVNGKLNFWVNGYKNDR